MSLRHVLIRAIGAGLLLSNPAPLDALVLEMPWHWSGFGDSPGTRGLGLIDRDEDGRHEIYAATDGDYWFEARLQEELEVAWSSLPNEEGIWAFAVAEGTGGPRIATAHWTSISVYDADSKALLVSIPNPGYGFFALGAGDLDGDSDLELAACTSLDLWVFDLETGAPEHARYGFGCTDLAMGQLDDDAPLEIALVGSSFGDYVLDGQDLAVQWVDPDAASDHVRLGDLDGDGELEALFARTNPGRLRALDLPGAVLLWDEDVYGASDVAVTSSLAHPGSEVLVPSAFPDKGILVLDGLAGVEVGRIPGPYRVSHLWIGELDGDEAVEILTRSSGSSRLTVIDGESFVVEGRSPEISLEPGAIDASRADGVSSIWAVAHWSSTEEDGQRYFSLDASTGMLQVWGPILDPSSFENRAQHLVATNIDADPAVELCLASGYQSTSGVGCFDGLTGAEEWHVTLSETVAELAAANIDAEPLQELLVGTTASTQSGSGPRVWALEAESGWLKWASPALGLPGSFATLSSLRAGNVDLDAGLEIVVGDDRGSIAIVSASDGALELPSVPYPFAALDLAQLDGDAQLEVVTGTGGGLVEILDPSTGTPETTLAQVSGAVRGVRTADLDRDGLPDLVAAADDRVTVLRLVDGAPRWVSPYLGDGAGAAEALLVGDLDGDSLPDLAVASSRTVSFFEVPPERLFVDGFESGDTTMWSAAFP